MDRKQLLEGWKVKRLGEIASINVISHRNKEGNY
jgi:hypothetical protein